MNFISFSFFGSPLLELMTWFISLYLYSFEYVIYIYISICVWVNYLTHIWMNYIRVCGDLFLSLLPLDFCGFSESVGLGRET